MDFSRLEKNICDVVKEEQIKLGYRREAIRLYYPLPSLNHYLGTNYEIPSMQAALGEFCAHEENRMGRIEVSNQGERFCFYLLPEVSEYVKTHTPEQGFLYDLIQAVADHPTSMKRVLDQFHRYSENVHVEKVSNGEFDYLVYFEGGEPDDFLYCLTDEGGGHVIYHRYTREDYEDFGF